jgi:hypothetical protein
MQEHKMSDPVTNVEIEDVLSSIRRLVSEEDRAVDEPVEAAHKHGQEAARFVLTPALRVADAPVEEVEAAPEGDTAESDAEEIAETLSVAEADPLPEVVEEENTQDAAVAEDAAPVEVDAESEVEADIEDEAERVRRGLRAKPEEGPPPCRHHHQPQVERDEGAGGI